MPITSATSTPTATPMHVLLLAYHFPPAKAVGAIRPAKLALALADAGHRVTVLTARLPGETDYLRVAPPGITVRTVQSVPNPREFYLLAKRSLQRMRGRRFGADAMPVEERPPANGNGRGAASRVSARDADPPFWKRAIFSLLWLPDDRQGFIPSAVAAAWDVMWQDPVDLVYTTSPPHSVHLAGLALAATSRVRWVAEFRDPWTTNPFKPLAVRTAATDGIERWLEGQTLRTAERVIVASDGIHGAFASRLPPDLRAKIEVVRNGIDRLDPPRPLTTRPLRVVHAGTFYAGRDPRPFLRALAAVRARRGLTPESIEVEFVGNARRYEAVSIEEAVRALGLEDIVRFRDWVPQAEARTLIESAGLLLLLAQEQPAQIPNKLYDYLGVRRPILAFVDRNGESAEMLRRVGGHHLVYDNEAEAAARALEAALDASAPAAQDEALLESWTTDRQMHHLVTLLGVPA